MDLFEAAATGDIAQLTKMSNQTNLEARNEYGRSPLMVAMKSKQATAQVVELLLQQGADPNALTIEPEPFQFDAETLKSMQEAGVEVPEITRTKRAAESVLAIAAKYSSYQKIEALVAAGADTEFINESGYGILLSACYGAFDRSEAENERIIRLLHRSGAPFTKETGYGETVVSVLSNNGQFELLKVVLELGAAPQPLNWTPLFYAVAFEELDAIENEIEKCDSLEVCDCWDRTPFLLAIVAGKMEAANLLFHRGSNVDAKGRCGQTAMMYAAQNNDVKVCKWLIELGCDVAATNDFDGDALSVAIDSDAAECVQTLISAGADAFQKCKHNFGLMHSVQSPEMFNLLAKQGLDTSELGASVRRHLSGGTTSERLNLTEQDFLNHRARVFGTANPQRMNNVFWDEMVRTRTSAYQANDTFQKSSFDFEGPTWCFDRFGHSFTPLPDGRYVEIGGEHEDSYDPDFCIYNDVVIHAGNGEIEIYGYPESVFPPTDFHTATYVDEKIFVVGCLGYPEDRQYGQTPVYVLDCRDWSIEKVSVNGPGPGWISRHTAILEGDRFIKLRFGKIGTAEAYDKNAHDWILDTAEMTWSKVE